MNARVSELDGVRAIAVSAVLYTHFANETSDLGHFGVRVFFVLSAFLITGILVNARDASNFKFMDALRAFYLHRAFRILPAYFLMIASVIVTEKHVGLELVFNTLFLSNFWFFMKGVWQPWPYSALWTLSVEWQFYLFWPFVVLTCSNRNIAFWAVALILSAMAFWAIVIWRGIDSEFVFLLTPASLDALAVGALARLFAEELRQPSMTQVIAAVGAAIATALLLGLATSAENVRASLVFEALAEFSSLLPTAILVCVASSRIASPVTVALRLSPLVWIGTISYGIYLFHVPVLALAMKLRTFGIAMPTEPSLLRFAVLSVVTVAVAALSWYAFERPFQRYGKQIAGKLSPKEANVIASKQPAS